MIYHLEVFIAKMTVKYLFWKALCILIISPPKLRKALTFHKKFPCPYFLLIKNVGRYVVLKTGNDLDNLVFSFCVVLHMQT